MDVRDGYATWLVVLCSVASLSAAGAAGNGSARLIDAVKAGNRDAVRILLREPGAVNMPEVDGTTALHWAVRGDDLELVQLLLRAGADAKAANRYGVQPLMLAATNGNPATLELLLKAGADPNAALPGSGETVLMTAARTGRVEPLRLLLTHGANVHARESEYGETALIWAAEENHAEAVQLLIEAGAELNGRSGRVDLGRLRLGQSVLPRGEWTPLMYAARQDAMAVARTLADAHADLNLMAPDGATALVLAIINAHYDLAAMLLEKGADPDIADVTGMAALYAAVDMNTLAWSHGRAAPTASGKLDSLAMVQTLLAHGADPNAKLKAAKPQRQHTAGDPNLGAGATPLMRAAKTGDVAAMRLLLEHGADPTATLKNGTTLLMIASGMGWRAGHDTLRDRGTEAGAIEAIQVCLELGGDLDAVNDKGQTALHGSLDRGPSVIEFLVKQGANMQARDKTGRTPLEIVQATIARAGQTNHVEDGAGGGQTDHVGMEVRQRALAVLLRLSGKTEPADPLITGPARESSQSLQAGAK